MPPLVILMIDDNPFFARHVERMCADLIAGEGGAWGWSRTAAEGIAQVGVLSPALVLLDPTMHEDGHLLAGYCRELAATAAPATPAFLFLTNPVHQLDQVLSRLTTDDRLTVGTLSKPFGPQDLTEKIAALLAVTPPSAPTPTPTSAMPDVPAAPASRFSWLTTTPEVSGYAHLDAAGTVLEWSGEEKDRGPHGALVYLQRLASLCGEDLGLGPAAEVDTVGPAGCGLSVHLGKDGALNVLTSPRANLRALAARAVEVTA